MCSGKKNLGITGKKSVYEGRTGLRIDLVLTKGATTKGRDHCERSYLQLYVGQNVNLAGAIAELFTRLNKWR
jgi:hypothetical protein